MTRDEAEMLAIKAVGFEFSEDARRQLAIMEALGTLKFEEPKKPAADVALEAIRDAFARYGRAICSLDVLVEIQSRGLKIVEKD